MFILLPTAKAILIFLNLWPHGGLVRAEFSSQLVKMSRYLLDRYRYFAAETFILDSHTNI